MTPICVTVADAPGSGAFRLEVGARGQEGLASDLMHSEGAGKFARVYSAELRQGDVRIPVAVKAQRDDHDPPARALVAPGGRGPPACRPRYCVGTRPTPCRLAARPAPARVGWHRNSGL